MVLESGRQILKTRPCITFIESMAWYACRAVVSIWGPLDNLDYRGTYPSHADFCLIIRFASSFKKSFQLVFHHDMDFSGFLSFKRPLIYLPGLLQGPSALGGPLNL